TVPGGAEGVGFQDLGAGFGVLLMDLANGVGRGEVKLIEAAVDEDAARVEHGTHGAIGHNDAGRQLVAEFLSAGSGGSSHVETVASAVGNRESAMCFILPQVGRGALRNPVV